MTADHHKFVNVATQELHQMHSNSTALASDAVVPLMIVAILIGVLVAIWIFRGGLSRLSQSDLQSDLNIHSLQDDSDN
jgi:cell division protein FtsX